jgi:putative transposase
MSSAAPAYKNHRYPIEIVACAIWLYFRFNLSLREVEEMLLERGIVVSYETIRRWCRKHGSDYARRLRRKVSMKNDVWHLDEVAVRINGRKCWLWRAVDQDGCVLDEIVQTRMFYNPKRKHVRNGMLSPVESERQQEMKTEGI